MTPMTIFILGTIFGAVIGAGVTFVATCIRDQPPFDDGHYDD